MKIFKISCDSKCHTYFTNYLRSVIVIADCEKDALAIARAEYRAEWVNDDLKARLISDTIKPNMIIAEHYSSDY